MMSHGNGRGNGAKTALSAFMLGAVAGSVASLLFAPASGRRTRRAIRREGRRMKFRALDAQERGRDALERVSEAAHDTVRDVKDALPLTRR